MRVSLADLAAPGRIAGQPVTDQPVARATDRTVQTTTQAADTSTPAMYGPTSQATASFPSGIYLNASDWAKWQAEVTAANTAAASSALAAAQAKLLAQQQAAQQQAATSIPAAIYGGTSAIAAPAGTSAFTAAGYIDPQGNLWALGASGQVGSPDAVNLGVVNGPTLTSTAQQTLAAALQGHTSQLSGYLLFDAAGLSAVESAYGIGTAGLSSSTLLLIAAGAAAVFLMSRQ
jgi:hypothetical protein